jgi:RNA polymerase primary sigma factor
MNDLVSEGNIGLMKAARNYDGARGTRFAVYAKSYIKEAIEAAINEQSGIYRLPKGETNAQAKEQSKAFSVDAPLEEGKHMSLLSVLSDPSAPLPDKLALEKSIKNELVDAMDVLNYRERIIIESFYGIDQPHRTFAEIGEQMGLKRERVRQIRNTAVRKLRKNTTSDMLKAYLA